MPRPRYRRNFFKRPRSFALETAVSSPSHADTRNRSGSATVFRTGWIGFPGANKRPPSFPEVPCPGGMSIIRRRETGVRVGSPAPSPGAATDLSVRQLGDLFARIAPRRDGILVPMGKSSRADGKNSPGHGNGAVAGVKTSVSLRFQSKSVVKQADSG